MSLESLRRRAVLKVCGEMQEQQPQDQDTRIDFLHSLTEELGIKVSTRSFP